MTDKIDNVLIVGGGDVGLLTALSLQKLVPGVDVRVVDDFQQEVPQVGKSTYSDIQRILHGTLDIDEIRFISEVKPIWKASVFFRDWCGCPPFQYTFDSNEGFLGPDTNDLAERSHYYYEELGNETGHHTRDGEIVAQRKSPWYYQNNGDLGKYEKFAYHLTTRRFNSFLRDLCRERGVTLVDDAITSVETTRTSIDTIRSDDREYEADLYVDATGFNRVLRSAQDVAFRNFEFPLDRAFNAQIDRPLSEVIPATVIETGDYGWFWQIDTYDNRDLGYVFDSEFVDDETARTEFREFVAEVAPGDDEPEISVAELDSYAFTSGYYDRAWAANCVAIGNAEGFVEPLQSTALTANALTALELASILSSNDRIVDDDLRGEYNEAVRTTWESIYDFIAVHYIHSSGDTAFWQQASSIDTSPRVERIGNLFDRRGFDPRVLQADEESADLAIFSTFDFFEIMRKMGETSKFHESNRFEMSDSYRHEAEQYYQNQQNVVENYHLDVDEFYKGILESGR